jgi:O-glycosyl hydrolase
MRKKTHTLFTALLLVFTMALIAACTLDVVEPIADVALTDPYISKQPASYSYFDNETPDFPLSIDVYEWAAADGDLSYQWYTFEDIDDFVLGDVIELDGADGLEYTPGTAANDVYSATAGSVNYYYAVVTNNNPNVNVGEKIGSAQSDVAIISFTAAGAGNALPPIISRNPGNAGYQAGRAVNALGVRTAARSDRANARLSYQWYTLTIEENETTHEKTIIRELVPNATASSFQPLELIKGANYYYVEVTSTEGTAAGAPEAMTISVPAIIEILPGARAIAPSITVQPKDRMYFIGETVGKLSVEGETRDDGVITYQWYSIPTSVIPSGGGTELPNATGSELTLTINNNAVGTYYYYAAVTNTQEFVTTDQTTARANSKVAKISVAQFGTLSHNAVVTVANPKTPDAPGSNRYQYVRGYGGMDVAWANFPETKPEDMETMYNPDTGLAFNINRIMISPGFVNPSDGIQDLINRHRPNYYNNVKIVNKYGGYNLASPWSPPKEWKSNNSINGGGHLLPAYRKQFAQYLKAFAQDMYDHGAPIYAISISNEPNYTAGYDGCEWTPNEMRDFYKEVGRFTNGVRGYGGGRTTPTVLTVNGESANNPDINIAALTDTVSRSAIDLLCRHVYGNQTSTLWRYGPNGVSLSALLPNTSDTVNILNRSILNPSDTTKMEVWMTEHNINSANATAYPSDSTWPYVWRYMNDVDLVMRLNNENAFVWWASKRFYSMIGDGQYGTREGAVLPRGWGLSHYAKYTIDTHRIVATVSGDTGDGNPITFEGGGTNVNSRTFSLDNDSVRITAYASITSGKDNAPINEAADDVEFISLVMLTPTITNGTGGHNMGTIKIDMPAGFKIGSYTAIRSTGARSTQVHQQYAVTISQDREHAYVELGRSSMLSVKFIKQ